MSRFLRCYKAEFMKRKHTVFYPLHFAIPALLVIGVNLLFVSRGWNIGTDYIFLLVFQGISIAMPLLCAVICGIVCDNEANAGNCHNILTSPYGRITTITAQFAMLITMCAMSIALSIAGIIITINVLGGISISISLFVRAGIAVWFCVMGIYALNLFLGYKLGIGLCSMLGFLGIIIASLGTIGFFDGIWRFIPQSWAIRFTTTLIEYSNLLFLDIIGVLSLTLLIVIAVFMWFRIWEMTKDHE